MRSKSSFKVSGPNTCLGVLPGASGATAAERLHLGDRSSEHVCQTLGEPVRGQDVAEVFIDGRDLRTRRRLGSLDHSDHSLANSLPRVHPHEIGPGELRDVVCKLLRRDHPGQAAPRSEQHRVAGTTVDLSAQTLNLVLHPLVLLTCALYLPCMLCTKVLRASQDWCNRFCD